MHLEALLKPGCGDGSERMYQSREVRAQCLSTGFLTVKKRQNIKDLIYIISVAISKPIVGNVSYSGLR